MAVEKRVVVKANAMLNAVQVEEPVTVPLPGGDELTIAYTGTWVLYNDDREFKGVVEDKDIREKWAYVK